MSSPAYRLYPGILTESAHHVGRALSSAEPDRTKLCALTRSLTKKNCWAALAEAWASQDIISWLRCRDSRDPGLRGRGGEGEGGGAEQERSMSVACPLLTLFFYFELLPSSERERVDVGGGNAMPIRTVVNILFYCFCCTYQNYQILDLARAGRKLKRGSKPIRSTNKRH